MVSLCKSLFFVLQTPFAGALLAQAGALRCDGTRGADALMGDIVFPVIGTPRAARNADTTVTVDILSDEVYTLGTGADTAIVIEPWRTHSGINKFALWWNKWKISRPTRHLV